MDGHYWPPAAPWDDCSHDRADPWDPPCAVDVRVPSEPGLYELDLVTGVARALSTASEPVRAASQQRLLTSAPVAAPAEDDSGTSGPVRERPDDAIDWRALSDAEARGLHRLLWGDPGELDRQREPTPSEADARLLRLLVKAGIRDEGLLETLWLSSWNLAPGREKKLRRDDYVRRTVAWALRTAPAKAEPPAAREAERARARSLGEILRDPEAQQPPQAVVPGLAWAGRITLVAAREGVGKSTLFGAAAAAVTTGAEFLGERCAAGTVLWVLVEEHLNDLVIRALRFQTARGEELQVLERPDEPLAALEAEVARLKPALVVVDTLHAFAAPLVKDKSQSDDWLTVMAALDRIARTTNAAVLMAAQALKSTGEYRDSGSIGHGADVVLNLARPDEASAVRILKRQKARWPLPDLHVELVGDEYRRTSARATVDKRREALRAALTGEPQTAKQLAGQIGRKQRSVEQDLQKLYAAGEADRVGSGKRGDPFRFLARDSRTRTSLCGGACGNESQSPQHADARMCGNAGNEDVDDLPF